MEIKEKIKNDEFDDSFKNVIFVIIIILFAYLIERIFPESYFKNFFFLLIIIILLLFAMKNFFRVYIDKIIFHLISISKKYLPKKYFFIENDEESNKKEITEKIKNIYQFGYLKSRINSNKNINNNEINAYKINNNIKNEEFLYNKISNINKIKRPIKINDYFKNENYFNNQDINYYKNDKIKNEDNYYKKKLTKLPNSNENNANDNKFDNKIIISSPFKDKINSPSSNDYSSNFHLFSYSNNTKKKQNLFIDSNDINPINRFPYLIKDKSNNDFFEKIIPKNKEISFQEYQKLIKNYENTKSLNKNYKSPDYSKNKDKIPKELLFIDYNKWISKMKIFISKNLIPDIITKHDNNISILNSFLYYFDLKITQTLPEKENNNYLDNLKVKLSYLKSNKINIIKEDDNNIINQDMKDKISNNFNYNNKENKNNIFSSINNFYNTFNDTNEINNINEEQKLKCIFYGDTIKIKEILLLIEIKIIDLNLQKKNEYKGNSLRKEIINAINYNNNPFLKKDYTKTIDDYLRNINNNYTLTNLQKLLYERIILNERLYPKELFNKKSKNHALLVIEYALERFRQLQHNFNDYGNGSKGGDFLGERWCSLLPTDSQLIAHLIVNYIENIYLVKNDNYQQRFLISFPMSYFFPINETNSNIKNSTSIYIYQINPSGTEPKYNVVYNNILIPCLLDNMNLFHAFCIYFYLLNIKSRMFVMALGIHDFINNIIN